MVLIKRIIRFSLLGPGIYRLKSDGLFLWILLGVLSVTKGLGRGYLPDVFFGGCYYGDIKRYSSNRTRNIPTFPSPMGHFSNLSNMVGGQPKILGLGRGGGKAIHGLSTNPSKTCAQRAIRFVYKRNRVAMWLFYRNVLRLYPR